MRNKILFVSMATMGGCQRVTLNYAKILYKKGFACEILLWVDCKDANNVMEQYIPESIPVHYLNCRIRELPLSLYKFIRERGGFDCVFSSWTLFNISLCIAKLIPLCKLSKLVIRDDNMPSRHDRKIQMIMKLFGRFADLIIAQTEEMREEMEKVYGLKNNTITILNPIDKDFIETSIIEDFSNENKLIGTPIYIASGRIAEQKDYITLVRAFAEVKKIKTEAMLYIMGDDYKNKSYKEKVLSEIIDYKLENSIKFLGFQSNPYQFIKQADVFVLSSIYEGLPNVMIEALYLGKPIATTSCIPFIDQIIKNGVNGYKSPVSNPKILASAMLDACSLVGIVKRTDLTNSEVQIEKVFKCLVE